MKNLLSIITDRILKTSYQNKHVLTQINIKDNDLVINLLSKFILPILMLFGFYIHSHGDYTPGGGFQAGVIFACVLCLYYFISIDKNKKRLSHIILTCISTIGFIVYIGIGIIGIFTTGNFLDFTFLPLEHNNARGVFIVEFGISLVVFSSISRIFITLLNLLKNIKSI